MAKGLEYLIKEVYGLSNCNESVLDKVIEKAKRIEEEQRKEEIEEIKKALLLMAKKCRVDMVLSINNYLENVSKNIEEIIQSLKQPK